jgi:diguanylate cyclase (GGDEF)-like protein
LQTIARRLGENTRAEDTVCRHGGDEFLYLLTEIQDRKQIGLIAEKIVKVIEAPCTFTAGGLDVSPSIKVSIGIAVFPKDGTTADALVKCADQAMYRAKKNKSGYAFAP